MKHSSKMTGNMSDNMATLLDGLLLDDDHPLNLGQLSRACSVHAEWVIELVDEGILEPHGNTPMQWEFRGNSLHRARCVQRLQQDLGVNLAGAALALELLQEIRRLRQVS